MTFDDVIFCRVNFTRHIIAKKKKIQIVHNIIGVNGGGDGDIHRTTSDKSDYANPLQKKRGSHSLLYSKGF